MSGLKVLKSGIFTLLEDSGRYGYLSSGITQSGVMDKVSYNYLNKLLQNQKDTNCLEIAFGSLEFKSMTETYIATTGAKCEFSINNEIKQNYKVYKINKNDTITIGKITNGQRVYFGVKGGFHIEKELGSNSTTIKESIGGVNGSAIKKDTFLPCSTYKNMPLFKLKDKYIQKYEDKITLRVVLGYQEDSFDKGAKDKFFSSVYTITKDFNRMGCRLDGDAIECNSKGIISEAISYGAIQIPPNGKPIILLNDRQTIGGYPKIGSVIPYDCYMLSQMKVGAKVCFEYISLEEAIELTKSFENSL